MAIPCTNCMFPLDKDHIRFCNDEDTPLHFSSRYGHVNCVKAWLDAGADVNKPNEALRTPLVLASQYGWDECVEVLIGAGADVNVKTDYGYTPLVMALDNRHDTCVELLVKAGADVNISPNRSVTALERAIQYKSKASAELLIDAGADVNEIVRMGLSARLKALVSEEHAAQLRAKLKEAAQEDAWMYTDETCVADLARECNAEGLEMAIEAGADVNDEDSNGVSAVIWACEQSDVDCLKLLIKAGADVNGCDEDENTPLIRAVLNGSHQCAELLVNAGADVNSENDKGFNAIDRACQLGFDKCVEILIKGGADLSTPEYQGSSPILEAAAKSSFKCLDLIIKAGADVNQVNGIYMHTPLILAVYYTHSKAIEVADALGKDFHAENHSHLKCVDLLIQAGADVNAKEYYGYTPLMHAAKNGHIGCSKSLLKSGAHVNIRSTCARKRNALDEHFAECPWMSKPLVQLLYAAGEWSENEKMKENVDLDENRKSLKGLCREAIRSHLLKLEPKLNLFVRIPELQLPSQLTGYLLFNTTLEDEGLQDDLFRGYL